MRACSIKCTHGIRIKCSKQIESIPLCATNRKCKMITRRKEMKRKKPTFKTSNWREKKAAHTQQLFERFDNNGLCAVFHCTVPAATLARTLLFSTYSFIAVSVCTLWLPYCKNWTNKKKRALKTERREKKPEQAKNHSHKHNDIHYKIIIKQREQHWAHFS